MLEEIATELIAVFLAAQLIQIGFEARLLWLVSSLKSDVERNSNLIDDKALTDGGEPIED